MSDLFTPETLAEYLKVSKRTVERYIASREIAVSRRGRQVWILPKDVDAFLQNNRVPDIEDALKELKGARRGR